MSDSEDDIEDPLAWTRMHEKVWYVLIVSPLCEKAVARRLSKRIAGTLTFAPIVTKRVQRGHRRRDVESVVFPRYVFAGFAPPVPWWDVREVLGVQGVIAFDGAPHRVAADLVADVIARCGTGYYGAKGSQADWCGEIDRLRDLDRMRLDALVHSMRVSPLRMIG